MCSVTRQAKSSVCLSEPKCRFQGALLKCVSILMGTDNRELHSLADYSDKTDGSHSKLDRLSGEKEGDLLIE